MLARPVTFRTTANQTNNEIKTMIKYFMFCVCICNISVCWIFKWCWLGHPGMLFWVVPLDNERASWSIFPILKILYLSSAFAELCCKSCSCTCVGLHHYRSVGTIYRGVYKQYTLTCIRCWRAPWTCPFAVGEHLQGQGYSVNCVDLVPRAGVVRTYLLVGMYLFCMYNDSLVI